jgi:rubredoxin
MMTPGSVVNIQEPVKEVMTMPSWKCANCGYTFESDAPPDQCPSCKEKCEFLDNTCYTPDCTAEGMDPRIAKKT